MTGRLAGRTAIVTGAASLTGIGFAAAARLVREGASVLLSDIDSEGAAERAAELRLAGGSALGVRHDVACASDWENVLNVAESTFGPLDVLVNNAGIAVLRMIEDLTEEDWHRQIDVNMKSVYLGCRGAIERMRRHARPGSIINVSSAAGLIGMRRCTAYSASKGGIRLMTKSLALETALDGIRVNSVHPGVIETAIQNVATANGGAHSALIHAAIPMQRAGHPDEVAAMIAFLASDDAQYVTGAEFAIDGGLTAQ